MASMILRRMRDLCFLVLVTPLVTVMLLRAAPGDYCNAMLPDHASKATHLACEADAESPFWNTYLATLYNLAHGNLGHSLSSRRTVLSELSEHSPYTFMLGTISFGLSVTIGVCGGALAAYKRYYLSGWLLNWTAILVLSLPSFLLALLLIQIFARSLGWVSILGHADEWTMTVLPIVAITLPLSAWFLRITRNAAVGVLLKDYVRTAEAKGLRGRDLLFRHVMRNALSAIIPLAGVVLSGLLDGTLLIEIIFNRPGLGRYTLLAVQTHDYPALQGVVLLVVSLTVSINLIADLLYAQLFPYSSEDMRLR